MSIGRGAQACQDGSGLPSGTITSMHADASSSDSSVALTPAELLYRLSERVDALDRAGAIALALEAVAAGRISVADLYTQVIGPYLSKIGSRWQHGSERVWQEHFATHVARTIVEALYPTVIQEAATVPRAGRTVLLVCPPREQHELGLRMLSDRFELAGWDAVFLGADTPVEEIVAASVAVHADLVALSVSTIFERVELRCFIDTLHEALPGTRVVIGGPAFARDPSGWPADELLDPAELGLPGSPAGA
jgi:MerR family transcriptional regulator, light-induced transcriptional regulator